LAETISVDLCVIGGGLAGLTAAVEACRLGASVVLIERHRLGGSYMFGGTVPARALAAAAAQAQAMRMAGSFGIAAETPRINARKLHDAIQEVVAGLAPKAAVAHLEALGVRVITADARFADSHTILAGEDRIKARTFVVATGSRSTTPDIPGLDRVPYFTSETIFDNTRRLTHLLVVGSGPTALELAQSFNRLGTQVTVVGGGHTQVILDPELAAIIAEQLRSEGVEILADSTVTEVQPRSQGIGIVTKSADGDGRLDVSHILVAGERLPNVELLDLDKAGVKRHPSDRRRVELSARLRTSNRRIYVVGDATGVPERSHLAVWQATAVVHHALLLAPFRLDAAAAPVVFFTDPEVATIGLSEAAARQAHGDGFEVLRGAFGHNDRARANRAGQGLIKLIAGRDGAILGAGIVGDRAGELIATLGLAMSQRLKVGNLARLVAPHPTLSETIIEMGREYQQAHGVTALAQRLLALRRYLP
jgi:pyruvate/2-oxoglutarate dehydrogenase complex dihydrolipoamide dehydrogenase (E3) component